MAGLEDWVMHLVGLLAVVFAGPAWAQEAISFSGMTTVEHGVQTPFVQFDIFEPGQLSATVSCGGRQWQENRRVAEGAQVQVQLSGIAEGVHACKGAVHFALDNGATVEQNLNLNVASLGLIQFQTQDSDVDLAAKSLKLHPSRPLTQAVATCIGERGRTVEEVQIDLSNPTEPVVQWSTSDEVVKVVVNAQDEHGFSAVLELTPWHYSIPHEDVVFATGQDAITAEEAPKLEKAWTDIVDVLDRYGSVVVIKLYVAGYTDTVGDAGGNQGLSERRARSISAWFRNRGFSGEIAFQGFGERGQAVQTGDGVDEARNRRAVYILAASPPPTSPDLPGSNWRGL